MKRLALIPLILFFSIWATPLNADIYTWTDDDGVLHFTNYKPPKHAKLMIKTADFATDYEAVEESIKAERLKRQQLDLQEAAEQEKLISMKQQELEERLEEIDRRTEELINRSAEISPEVPGTNADYDDSRDVGNGIVRAGAAYGYSYYYPYKSHRGYYKHGLHGRSHFKYRGGHHFGKRHFGHFGKHHFRGFNKHHFGKFHHRKGFHSFKGRSHHFKGHFGKSHHFRKKHFGHFGKHHFGNSHHRKSFHGFKGKSHHFKGKFRGGHRSSGHFRVGHRGLRR